MAESTMQSSPSFVKVITPAAGYAVGQVIQLPDGRAGVISGTKALGSGEPAAVQVSGHRTLAKTASLNVLEGGKVYWDRSANTATPLLAAAGADFFIGTCVVDSLAAATTVIVNLNNQPVYTIDIMRDPTDTTLVTASAALLLPVRGPGYVRMHLDATSEVQKVDIFSQASVPIDVPFIVEGRFTAVDLPSGAATDFDIGIANATHATALVSSTEHILLHLDNAADLLAYSDDGTTDTDAADTTVNVVEGTYNEFWWDCRDLTDCLLYVDGVAKLAASDFGMDDASGPLKLAAHLVKTTGTEVGEIRIQHLALRATDVV